VNIVLCWGECGGVSIYDLLLTIYNLRFTVTIGAQIRRFGLVNFNMR